MARERLVLAGIVLTVSACGGGQVTSKSAAASGVGVEDPSSEILVSPTPPVGCPKDEMGLNMVNMEGYTFQDWLGLVWKCTNKGWSVDTQDTIQRAKDRIFP